jgi:hypothetical protein
VLPPFNDGTLNMETTETLLGTSNNSTEGILDTSCEKALIMTDPVKQYFSWITENDPKKAEEYDDFVKKFILERLESGNVNTWNPLSFRTPLDHAISNDSMDLVLRLIGKGANLNLMSHGGFTPLKTAICCKKYNIMRILIENGADIMNYGIIYETHDFFEGYNQDALLVLIEYGGVLKESIELIVNNDMAFKAKVEEAQGKVAGNQLKIKRNLNYKRRRDYLMFLVQSKLIGKDAPSSVFSIFYKEIAAFL